METIINIDLGTGFSCMSVMEGGKPTVIPNAEGERTTPSIVAWTKNGDRLVGSSAKRQAITNPENTVYEIKRFIGKKYDECLEDIKKVSYKVVKAPNGDCRVKILDKEYSPEEISSFILAKLKKDAEAFLGLQPGSIKKAIITCPAYFNDAQRSATKVAGQLVPGGLEVIRVISEPTAAALFYGIGKTSSADVNIAVVDCGSGTTDVSFITCSTENVFETVYTSGDNALGGKDFDQHIMDWLISEFKKDTGIDISKDPMALQRLKDESEKAKIALSNAVTVEINIPFISANENGPQHLLKTLTRAKFEELTADLLDRLEIPCRDCLDNSGLKVDKVILVGGSTRIPSLQSRVKDIFGIEPSKDVNPDEAVSLGAAIQSGIITGDVKDILLLDVTPLTLSICTNGQLATTMVERNTTIPCKKTQTFSNATPMQSMATILVGQGERKMFNDNKLLGQFNVEITPCPVAGQAQIEVTYDIDANGILTVSAKDLALNKPANITITNSSGLSKEEIERAKAEAERYAEEDKKKVELVNLKNSAENLCNQLEKTMKDSSDKIAEDDRKSVETEISKLKDTLKGDDVSVIKTAMESLNKAWEPVVKKLYPNQPAGGQQFSAEDLKKMKNDPNFMNQFSQMFGGANPFAGAAGSAGQTAKQEQKKDDDGPIEAEVVD